MAPPTASSARQNEYFVPRDGIDREVITADICRYLGNDALVRPGTYNGTDGRPVQGYFVTAYRNLTTAMIDDLKADSARWDQERRKHQSGAVRYTDSPIHHRDAQRYQNVAAPAPGYPGSDAPGYSGSQPANLARNQGGGGSSFPPQPPYYGGNQPQYSNPPDTRFGPPQPSQIPYSAPPAQAPYYHGADLPVNPASQPPFGNQNRMDIDPPPQQRPPAPYGNASPGPYGGGGNPGYPYPMQGPPAPAGGYQTQPVDPGYGRGGYSAVSSAPSAFSDPVASPAGYGAGFSPGPDPHGPNARRDGNHQQLRDRERDRDRDREGDRRANKHHRYQ